MRRADISSTDAEHDAALAKAKQIRDNLVAQNWPQPVTGDSGNGAHLMFRVDLPNTPEITTLIKRATEAISFII